MTGAGATALWLWMATAGTPRATENTPALPTPGAQASGQTGAPPVGTPTPTPAVAGSSSSSPPPPLTAAPGSTEPPPPPVSDSGVAPETEAAMALARARAAYEYGDMEMVVDSARLVAEGRLRPTPAQRVQALRFLGIGLFLTGRPEGAETAFFDLLRQKPGAKLDPTHARPDVIAFFETVRSRHAEEIRQAARNHTGKRLVLACLPPIGQFQNGDRGRGLAVAALEIVSAGVAVGTYVQLKSWINKTDKTFPRDKTDEARTLKVLNYVSISLLIATIGYGIIDGVANFNRDEDEPPLAWLTPSGLGFRF